MHLLTVLAFGLLFWQAESSLRWTWLDDASPIWTLLIVALQPIVLALLARTLAQRTRRLLGSPERATRASLFYHRGTLLLRILLITGFAITVFATPWPKWFTLAGVHPVLQILGDFAVLVWYFAGAIAIWLAVFPLERDLRIETPSWNNPNEPKPRWGRRQFLDFNIRHHLLVVAIPLSFILFASNLTRGYQVELERWFGWIWAPELTLGLMAAIVFILAPAILRFVWKTRPLEAGILRARLEAMCERIGLRCRELLVWQTDGVMINAAVMGIVGPLRFVLLSDALLAAMTPQQIEAVFGHEAGHVRHRHMQHFLAFAFVGWLLVAGLMEGLAQLAKTGVGNGSLTLAVIEVTGILATVMFWGVGFGWVSRRFERQADLFGARCVTPEAPACSGPCSVHGDSEPAPDQLNDCAEPELAIVSRNPTGSNREPTGMALKSAGSTHDPRPLPGRGAGVRVPGKGSKPDDDTRLCTTGAAVFSSALDRVATLNGIAREERSWRHSSIGNRIRCLATLAGDPNAARRFERRLRRLQICLWAVAIVGAIACVAYWIAVPEPALLQLQASAPIE